MIDKRYIESAKEIRTSYIRLAEELNKYQGDVEILSNFLSEKIKDLEKINEEEIKKIKNKEETKKKEKKKKTKKNKKKRKKERKKERRRQTNVPC